MVLAFVPKKVRDKLQRIQNAAVRLITETHAETRVVFHGFCVMICTRLPFHSGCSTSLPWLFIGDFGTLLQTRPTCKVGYLADCCVPVSEVSGRQHLRSAIRRKLYRHRTFGTRAFSVIDPSCLIRCVIHRYGRRA